ncbi:hypothetical protein BU16DRAFT_268445 [Lophium mytilinum]|uniref:EthD domain-containing protein n=1 Tax=Lophium mytilinum TaxID=390894 RepID=A0A6A6R3J9_9PEZI|nr:hypothetical protein BU16DRAFT_268445 [Lophium mytilinum]
MPGEKQKYIKLQVYVLKKDDISDDEFHKHWAIIHGDECKKIPEFNKYVKRYQQFHQTPQDRELAKSVLGDETLPYDGCAEFWMESLEDFKKFRDSEGFKTIAMADGAHFIGAAPVCMVGSEWLQLGPKTF